MNLRSQSKSPGGEHLNGRTTLREATRADHERLHGQPALAALVSGTIDLPAYAALLGRLYGFHAPLEKLLAASEWAACAGAHVVSPRAQLLREDFEALADESVPEGHWNDMLKGASTTFAALENWLDSAATVARG